MDIDQKIFLDGNSGDRELLRAVSHLSASHPPSAFWTQVANDPSYRPFQRALAVYELFRRYLTLPATLEQVASMLAGGRWLLDAGIERVEAMGGEIPVRVPAGGAAFVIRLPGDVAAAHAPIGIYLALDRILDATLLREALTSRNQDPMLLQTRIVDCSVFPDSLEALNRD